MTRFCCFCVRLPFQFFKTSLLLDLHDLSGTVDTHCFRSLGASLLDIPDRPAADATPPAKSAGVPNHSEGTWSYTDACEFSLSFLSLFLRFVLGGALNAPHPWRAWLIALRCASVESACWSCQHGSVDFRRMSCKRCCLFVASVACLTKIQHRFCGRSRGPESSSTPSLAASEVQIH